MREHRGNACIIHWSGVVEQLNELRLARIAYGNGPDGEMAGSHDVKISNITRSEQLIQRRKLDILVATDFRNANVKKLREVGEKIFPYNGTL